jgi:hypothetical protein
MAMIAASGVLGNGISRIAGVAGVGQASFIDLRANSDETRQTEHSPKPRALVRYTGRGHHAELLDLEEFLDAVF